MSRKKNFPKTHISNSIIDQACSVKMAGLIGLVLVLGVYGQKQAKKKNNNNLAHI